MPRLIDRLAEKLREIVRDEYVSFVTSDEAFKLLKEYDAMREQEDREALLTNAELVDDLDDEPSDYTALSPEYANSDLPENFDEWGQGYGRCPTCGMPWDIVRPGKGQPACECGNV